METLGGPEAQLLPVFRTRDSPFAYTCRGCGRCCHQKTIRVGPYEVARLAAALGVTTGEVIRHYLAEDGATLKSTRDGACVFLEGRHCSVHGGRPLVCRTYPLGRVLSREDGDEVIVELRPHPESEGVYGRHDAGGAEDATDEELAPSVADYFQDQGVERYERTGRRYRDVLERLAMLLESGAAVPGGCPPLMDVDEAVRADCEARGVDVPACVEARVELHLVLLDRWLGRLEQA